MAAISTSQIRFTERSRKVKLPPASYWLLLTFLFLLYANLPLVMPALDALRPAKVVAGLALVALVGERVFARKSLEFAWPEGILLLSFLGAAALSSLTALWPRLAFESVSDLLLKMTIVFFFIVNCANTERWLRGVMWTVVIGGLLPAAGTLRNYLQGNMVDGRAGVGRDLRQSQRTGLQPGHSPAAGRLPGGRPGDAPALGAAGGGAHLPGGDSGHLFAWWIVGSGGSDGILRLEKTKRLRSRAW